MVMMYGRLKPILPSGSRLAFAVLKRFSSKVIERTRRAWARPMNHETMGTNWQEARVRSLES
jgi:hypothetical protein